MPYIGHLRGQCGTWEEALRQWLLQLPSAETKRYVGNFLSVYRVRPAAEADANSDDDDVDEPFQLEPAALANALRTQTPAAKTAAGKARNDDRAHRVEAVLAQADAWWRHDAIPRTEYAADISRYEHLDSAAAQKAARRRPHQAEAGSTNEGNAGQGSVAASRSEEKEPAVRAWTQRLDGHSACNAEQHAAMNIVAQNVAPKCGLRKPRGEYRASTRRQKGNHANSKSGLPNRFKTTLVKTPWQREMSMPQATISNVSF